MNSLIHLFQNTSEIKVINSLATAADHGKYTNCKLKRSVARPITNLLFDDLILELYQWHAQTIRGELTSSYQNCSDKNIIYNKVLYMHSNVSATIRGSSAKRKTNDFSLWSWLASMQWIKLLSALTFLWNQARRLINRVAHVKNRRQLLVRLCLDWKLI